MSRFITTSIGSLLGALQYTYFHGECLQELYPSKLYTTKDIENRNLVEKFQMYGLLKAKAVERKHKYYSLTELGKIFQEIYKIIEPFRNSEKFEVMFDHQWKTFRTMVLVLSYLVRNLEKERFSLEKIYSDLKLEDYSRRKTKTLLNYFGKLEKVGIVEIIDKKSWTPTIRITEKGKDILKEYFFYLSSFGLEDFSLKEISSSTYITVRVDVEKLREVISEKKIGERTVFITEPPINNPFVLYGRV